MAEEEEGSGAAAPHRGAQKPPEGMCVVERNVSGRGSEPSSERTRSGEVGIEVFVNEQRESGGRVGNGGVTEGEEGVEAASPQRG